MATLYVRDVPDELYERLKREAAGSRRSLSAETIEVLERSLRAAPRVSVGEFLAHAREVRERSRPRADSKTAVELIREDRER